MRRILSMIKIVVIQSFPPDPETLKPNPSDAMLINKCKILHQGKLKICHKIMFENGDGESNDVFTSSDDYIIENLGLDEVPEGVETVNYNPQEDLDEDEDEDALVQNLRHQVESLQRQLELETQLCSELEERIEFLERDNDRLTEEVMSQRSNISGSKRRSIALVMKNRNSLGYIADNSFDEKNVVFTNVKEYVQLVTGHSSVTWKNINDKIYLNILHSYATLFHFKNTISSDITKLLKDEDGKSQDDHKLRGIFFVVIQFIIDLLSETSFNFEALPYPMKWLIKSFPDVEEMEKGRGWLPLHWYLATSRPEPQNIRYLYQIYGEHSFQQTVSPLSIAVSGAYPVRDAIQTLISMDETMVGHRDVDGSFAVMHACASNITVDIVDLLCSTYSDSINISDNFGCYAIHYACFFGKVEVIKYLFERYPSVGRQTSGNGALALHEVVQNALSGNIDLVKFVYERNKEAIAIQDFNGCLPLHLAARGAAVDIVRFIYNIYPSVRSFIAALSHIYFVSGYGD